MDDGDEYAGSSSSGQNEVDTKPQALAAGSTAGTRKTASAAGRDLLVLGLHRNSQSIHSSVRIGWRAVSLDGDLLTCHGDLTKKIAESAQLPIKDVIGVSAAWRTIAYRSIRAPERCLPFFHELFAVL